MRRFVQARVFGATRFTWYMRHIKQHFKKVDPLLHSAITGDSWSTLKRPGSRFSALCRIIIGQQVSTKAAQAIFKRFKELFPYRRPRPEQALALGLDGLRQAGLSGSKCRYVYDLASRAAGGTLPLRSLHTKSNEEVVAHITAVHGLGKWSAEMFLMSSLGREDVFSGGDLGLRMALQKLYGLRALPDERKAEALARRWSPYRSYACRILWNSLDGKQK